MFSFYFWKPQPDIWLQIKAVGALITFGFLFQFFMLCQPSWRNWILVCLLTRLWGTCFSHSNLYLHFVCRSMTPIVCLLALSSEIEFSRLHVKRRKVILTMWEVCHLKEYRQLWETNSCAEICLDISIHISPFSKSYHTWSIGLQ